MSKTLFSFFKLITQTNLPNNKCIVQWRFTFSLTNSFSTHLIQYGRPNKANLKYVTKENNGNGFDKDKAKLILQMNFLSPEDALPYYKLPIKTLVHIYETTKNDNRNGFCSNRLYYISNKIKCSSSKLSECLVKRTFIYSLSFDWIESSLNVLLKFGVSGDRILRDLWVLKYHHGTIHDRLQKVQDMGIEKFYPWMVRCNEEILNRYITLYQETKDILGENKSTQVYLANRLNTSIEAVEEMCSKIPALKTIRVTKVKHFLDFLISEGFRVDDIARKPRVLSASPNTVKLRIEMLRKFGLSDINLNVLCRSRKDFQKYYESIQSTDCKTNYMTVTPASTTIL